MFCKSARSRPISLPLSVLFVSCLSGATSYAQPAGANSLQAVAPTSTPAPGGDDPFRKVVVLGDSISAGFQNGSLNGSQQPHGWASLIAQQAGFELTLPLIAAPGFPAVYELVQLGLPPVVQQEAGTTTGRDNPDAQVADLAVPGHTLYQLLNSAPVAQPVTGGELMTNLVLGSPSGTGGSQLQQAIAQKPSLIYLWIGGDDALPAIATGNPSTMTPVSTYASEFSELIAALQANTQARLIVGNVPDVTKIPYLTPASALLDTLHGLTNLPASFISGVLGIYPGDLVNPHGIADIETDVARITSYEFPFPLPAGDVLRAADVAVVQSTIDGYNQVIAQQVAAAGGTVVDVHGYIDTLAVSGIKINDYQASTQYLGGLFSIDGIHPTNTGYAVFANQFLAGTNAALGTTILPIDVASVAAQDPLFGPNILAASPISKAAQSPAGQFISPAATRGLDAVLFGLE